MHTCSTIKPGRPCIFMRKDGCSYNGGQCHPVVDSCQGCDHVEILTHGEFCRVYAEPALKWGQGCCNMSTNGNGKEQKQATTRRINPLKASKRSHR